MPPKAEIWVPENVSRENLKELLGPVGGRVEKFQELKPIPVDQVSPSSMAAFLKESYPSLKLDQDPSYSQIFDGLRDLRPNEQEELLVGFYSRGVEAFPNGKELGRFLARINNISWFKPKSEPNKEKLEELCHQVSSRLNLTSDLPLRIIKEDWDAARGAARGAVRDADWNAARDAAWGAVRGAEWGAAWDAARGAAWGAVRDAALGAAWDAARDTSLGAEWIVAKDLMPQRGYDKGNPFEPIIGMYEVGCWPIGIIPDSTTKKKEFFVFIPPIEKTA